VDAKFIKGSPIPDSIGQSADLFKEVETLRKAMQKEVDAVKERERELRESIIDRLSNSEDTGAAGKKYRVQTKVTTHPQMKDWDAFYEFVREHERFDLMQKRPSERAIADMWEAGEEVPGVGKFNKVGLSINKL